ncbi:glycosyltransferase [Ralstonia mannitolilytica]|uniref:Hyaluronan synthase n=2 Tax=Ralstonia mannitolilytica TaxID=105219 RepID=A0AAJ4ZJM2_9RALS|nr:glycosyltransferase [Ralstonia mannitolilytica]CAG2151500.1 O-antigen biosynthesis glycosyltransferase WbnJ [Ralstonia mannitolilytica]SUD86991.1 Hyaluronan synthase [Ralstonia mannitolilytica]SUD92914.1 Hyaluronan synthase [Ralstonia mannitolilytica]SUD96652.1 Hyaluronan synthase [Ralstonia mannitolilytica]
MISVIMGVCAVDDYLKLALDSITKQTYQDFELIVIANGPRRDLVKLAVEQHCGGLGKVRVYTTPIGQLSHALNIGIGYARGEYIARMDSDDVSHPERLERQLRFLEERKLDLVGSDINLIDESGTHIGVRIYPKGDAIDRKLPFSNPFAHNTVLAKKSVFIEARGYNSGFNSEDYDLWLRVKRLGVRWDNIPEVLLDYRIHSGASQRRLLGYAECTALAVREFILDKSVINLFAIGFHFFKSLVRARK